MIISQPSQPNIYIIFSYVYANRSLSTVMIKISEGSPKNLSGQNAEDAVNILIIRRRIL